jgi:hypothetical protein
MQGCSELLLKSYMILEYDLSKKGDARILRIAVEKPHDSEHAGNARIPRIAAEKPYDSVYAQSQKGVQGFSELPLKSHMILEYASIKGWEARISELL